MPLQVHAATAADADRLAKIEHDAYANNPFTPYLFPGPMPAAAGPGRAAELAEQLRTDATTRWTKVVDTDISPAGGNEGGQEQVIAMAKWHVYPEAAAAPTPRTWGPGCNVEACEALFGGLAKMRGRIMAGKPCVYLHLLQTDPKHERRGAGGMLIQDMLKSARELGLPVFLESSAVAHALYLKHGFEDIEKQSLDFAPWGLDQTHETWAMVCENP
ncbi:acetyltransferase [Microdochium trichocladiopsis]|uniref:Acetyltransferase n=1 Tax=Microdochium trichocladiopsis TaxID=1682393 RepID=A0A9P9BT82_9PEZI|nr:acetyltransferase [Microdochium trichocladiopsis]KAH7035222.1 acetyltransferase [Microdochium trichocladiopsis]